MSRLNSIARVSAVVLTAMLTAGFAGCSTQTAQDTQAAPAPSDQAEASATPRPSEGQQTFASPDAAVAALLAAVQSNDHAGLRTIFGPEGKELTTGDRVTDANNYKSFAQKTLEQAQLEERDANTDILHIGSDNWPFPIPLVKDAAGTWFFDTNAGKREVLARHIGADELEAISICRAYVEAQREYASQDHNGDGILEYAQRLHSSPGKQDGLYWDAGADQPQSPFGPLVAQAAAEGYAPITGSHKNLTPFHGYYYHILKAQGAAAPVGAYSYVINGHMIAGFALVAYPAEYGKSGVMTFIVSHQGKVYQKDLGTETDAIAGNMTEYNPDKSWTLVKE